MNYIDYSKAVAAVEKYPHAFGSEKSRQVGRDHHQVSAYHGITRFFEGASLNPDSVQIQYQAGSYEIPDHKIRAFAAEAAADLRKKGRLYDGPTVTGFRSLDLSGARPVLTVQETAYPDFAGSCLALDWAHPLFKDDGGTLRDYYYQMYGTLPIERRPLANVFGVCGMLLVRDLADVYMLQIRRARHLASMPDTLGPSAAGTVDYAADYRTLADMVDRALGQEVEEELGLMMTEYEITPLAWGHDLVRGDNPQIFCLVNTWLDRVAVSDRLQQIPESHREFSEFAFIPLSREGQLPAEKVAELNFEAAMCYYMIEEYLQRVSFS
jgi:hypothetical protein